MRPFNKRGVPWIYSETDDTTSRKPTLVSIARDAPRRGCVTLETASPKKVAVVQNAVDPSAWDAAFSKLGISADDYFEHIEWLRKNGLPEHANAHLIHWNEERELTIPDLFEFAEDEMPPLFQLPDDLDLSNLFQFDEKKQK